MPYFYRLPVEAQAICEHQGWNDQSLIGILLDFVKADALGTAPEGSCWEDRLSAYFRDRADEETLE